MIPRLKLTFPHNWSCRVALHTNELNEEENLLATGGQEKYRYTEGEKERKEGRFRRVNKCKWVKLRQKKSRKSSNTKAMRFWSVTACCKEIKAGGIKWLKRAGATWVFTFFFFLPFSIPERMSRERMREQHGQSTSARCLFHLWQHPWGDWAIVNLEWNISKGCWSGDWAGPGGWVQSGRWNTPALSFSSH